MAVYGSPPLCAVDALWGGVVVWCCVTVVCRLYRNPPGMVTVSGWKCLVVRVMMRGVKWDQCTGRWPVKTWRKLSLNSV